MSSEKKTLPNPEQVEMLLWQRLGTQARGLGVLVEEGGVVLRGHAPSFHVKQLAQHVIMVTMGVRIVSNQIEVRARQSPGPDADA